MKRFPLPLIGLMLWTSCYTIVHDYEGPREITPGTQLSQASVKVGNVSGERRAHFLFWGLFPLKKASGATLVDNTAKKQYEQDFDGLTRVRIHEEQDPVDVLVGIVTLGIFTMVSVEAEAEVHQYAGGGA